MAIENYAFRDILETLAELVLYSFLLLIPGALVARAFDVLSFRRQRPILQLVIGLTTSIGLVPISLYLAARVEEWLALPIVWTALGICTLGGISVLLRSHKRSLWTCLVADWSLLWWVLALIAAGMLLIFVAGVDIQWGDRVWFSLISLYDFPSRLSLIRGITATGVPLLDPLFFPGEPVRLPYPYFWYLIASRAELLSGPFLAARGALFAGIAWTHIIVLAVVAAYLKFVLPGTDFQNRTRVLAASGLVFVSGLDFVFALAYALDNKPVPYYTDLWQETGRIPSWFMQLAWAPNHVAGLAAGMAGILFLMQAQKQPNRWNRLVLILLAGMAFASTLGLSVFCAIVFCLALVFWGVILLCRRSWRNFLVLAQIGLTAALFSIPFLLELLESNPNGSTTISWGVLQFEPAVNLVRSLTPIGLYLAVRPRAQELLFLLMLPLNYLVELGFFALIGLLHLVSQFSSRARLTLDQALQIVILAASLFTTTFMRTDVTKNDLAWRTILPAQFILLLWAVDPLLSILLRTGGRNEGKVWFENHYWKGLALVFLVIGVIGVCYNTFMVRFETVLNPADAATPQRTYALRQAYDWINMNLSRKAILQHNPLLNNAGAGVDHFHGLYADRQLLVSDEAHRAFYRGALQVKYEQMRLAALDLFDNPRANSADKDKFCASYPGTVLVSKDTDRSWSNPASWIWTGTPLYVNKFVRILDCARTSGRLGTFPVLESV